MTNDQRLRYRPLAIAALQSSAARVFILVAGNLRGQEIAAVFVSAIPAIARILRTHRGPFVGRIAKTGHVVVEPHNASLC